LKSTVAQYNAEQLISQREKVSMEIREQLSKRALEYSIVLDDVSITDLQFSSEFMASIEQKQVAQQMAERAKFIVFKNEEITKANVLRAEGEAEGAKLIAQAISEGGPGLVAIRKIEAASYIAEKLQNSPNVTFLSGNTMNMINLSGSGM
jgi:prohibitin 1